MSITRFWVVLSLAVVVGASCSPDKAAQEIEDKSKEIADQAAAKTKEVVSDVADKGKEIVSSTGEAITDGWITTKLKAKFADEKLLKDANINIETKDRIVTLKGTVAAADVKRRAVSVANGTEGVKSVVDQMTVKAK
jgi:hyperosmotically inducible protein